MSNMVFKTDTCGSFHDVASFSVQAIFFFANLD